MEEVHEYLVNKISFSDKKAYQDGQESLRAESFEYLEEQGKVIATGKTKSQRKHEYEEHIDILNAADIVFRCFLPITYDGPTTAKFWGAIRSSVQVRKLLGLAIIKSLLTKMNCRCLTR